MTCRLEESWAGGRQAIRMGLLPARMCKRERWGAWVCEKVNGV